MMTASASLSTSASFWHKRIRRLANDGGERSGVLNPQFSVKLTERQNHALRQEALKRGLSISETLRMLLEPWADKRLKEFDAPKD